MSVSVPGASGSSLGASPAVRAGFAGVFVVVWSGLVRPSWFAGVFVVVLSVYVGPKAPKAPECLGVPLTF